MEIVQLVLLALGPSALALAAWWGIHRLYREIRQEIIDAVRDFTESPGAGQPSQLAMVIRAAAKLAAEEIKLSLSGAMMGHASAMSKQIDAMEGDVVSDGLANRNPMMAALLNFSPALRKRVAKNPAAAMALSQIDLGGILGKAKAGSVSGNGHSTSTSGGSSFELGK